MINDQKMCDFTVGTDTKGPIDPNNKFNRKRLRI